jgi:nucleoside-diphosphate-sugar epimerase
MSNKILVTGVTGFVGKELSNNLSKNDLGTVRNKTGLDSNVTLIDIPFIDGTTDWKDYLVGVNTIIHLAACAHSHTFNVTDYQKTNVQGTVQLAMEAVKAGVRRFVFVSSLGVNGNYTENTCFSESSTIRPHNMYAQSKYDAEVELQNISKKTGLELVIVRPTLVYGPNAPGSFGSLVRLISKTPVLPFGLINNKRDFISVQNLANFLLRCATHPNAVGSTFLASESQPVSLREFTNAISLGLDSYLLQIPVPVSIFRWLGKVLGKSGVVDQLVGNLEVDSSNLKEKLDWIPPFTMEESMTFLKEKK